MSKQIIIAEQHRIAAVFSEDQIQELIVATGSHQIGDIYLGIVENVLPGIDAAFVNIGDSERNGFIHVSDLGPIRSRKTAGSITELLEPQKKVLVQVMKEPTGNKGPRLTGNVTLPGRYLVLMPYNKGVSLSSRIRNENERNHLRALAVLIKPPGMGLLVRTEASGVSEKAVMEDLELLLEQWERIQQQTLSTRAPALLNRDDDFIQRVLRDVYSVEVNRIVVDSIAGLKKVKDNLAAWNGGRLPTGVLVDQHPSADAGVREQKASILEYFRVNAAIREALKPRVDLPSGGYIIIEPTEALTVIDVNSGSSTGYSSSRETVLWTNCEAAMEIARQLRLRNIAGVIIVDFIDMDLDRDKLQVLEIFNKALRTDKARPQIAQLSELGLVELTRKRQGQNIYELFGRPCHTCGGLGVLMRLPGEPEAELSDGLKRGISKDAILGDAHSDTRPRGDRRSRPRVSPAEAFWQEGNELTEREGEPDGETGNLDVAAPVSSFGDRDRRRRRRRNEGKGGRDGRSEIAFVEVGRPETNGDATRAGGRSVNGRENGREAPREIVRDNGRDKGRSKSRLEATVELDEAGTLIEGRPERGERRSRRDNTRVTSQPAEVIAVPMTPEEQDVYAFMGISPLTLWPEEVRDPRSAIVSVILPGEVPPPIALEPEFGEESPTQIPIPDLSIPVILAPDETVVEPSPMVETESPDDPETSDGGGRRRRRRSSAS